MERKTISKYFLRFFVLMAFVALGSLVDLVAKPGDEVKHDGSLSSVSPYQALYAKLNLNQLGLSEEVYSLALKGWLKLKNVGAVQKDVLAVCDFTQSSNNNRFYIIDLNAGKLLFNTLVAHGRNTGEEFARSFSNTASSYQSSLGFYITGETYEGKHGLSLKLKGQEPGFNDNAEERAIVLHGAEYVDANFASQNGRLGRSLGCPAVPVELTQPIVQCIKDGSCLFIYYPEITYLRKSSFIQ
jgi:hypothetical protein